MNKDTYFQLEYLISLILNLQNICLHSLQVFVVNRRFEMDVVYYVAAMSSFVRLFIHSFVFSL